VAIRTARITVTTTRTELAPTGLDGGSSGSSLLLKSDAAVYIGGPDVTPANGWLLAAGEPVSAELDYAEHVYAIMASGTATVSVLRGGV